MTIKQQGGIFGRNPTFNDLEVDGSLSVDGDLLFTDTSNDRIGINTNSPAVTLDVNGGSTTQLRLTAADSTSASIINFGDQANVAVGRIIYSHVTDSFSFKTNNVNNRLTIDSSGNVTVGNGNLVMGTSGSGIDFSATSGTGTSELFDDYEEGTYTPALEGMTGGAVTYTSQFGRYTKIGRQVNVFFSITVNTNTNTGGNTGVSVPFVPDVGGSNYIYVGPIGRNSTSNSFITHVSFFSGIARALFYTPAAATLNGSAVTNGCVLSGSITYFV